MVCYFNFTFSIIKPLYSNYSLQDKKKKRKREGKDYGLSAGAGGDRR